jgi:hypothetical protein
MSNGTNRATLSMNGVSSRDHGSGPLPAAVFTILWDALSDLLGTAATAMLLRRAAQRATPRDPELSKLAIVRFDGEYRYTLPPAWHERTGGPQHALRHMVAELLPLLEELTGPLVVRHLAQIVELREQGIIPTQEEKP